ncbi:unnamed protein product [Amoebophrya sp. A25]|nr:unnamed protein product [Amoebophrya sp. A25]|eukprot:GSA25T00010754001.1
MQNTVWTDNDIGYEYPAFSPLRTFNVPGINRDNVCALWEEQPRVELLGGQAELERASSTSGERRDSESAEQLQEDPMLLQHSFPYYDTWSLYETLDQDFCSEFGYVYALLQLGLRQSLSKITPVYVLRSLQRWFFFPFLTRADWYSSVTDNGFMAAGEVAFSAKTGSAQIETDVEQEQLTHLSQQASSLGRAEPLPPDEGRQVGDEPPCTLEHLTERVLYNGGAPVKNDYCLTLNQWRDHEDVLQEAEPANREAKELVVQEKVEYMDHKHKEKQQKSTFTATRSRRRRNSLLPSDYSPALRYVQDPSRLRRIRAQLAVKLGLENEQAAPPMLGSERSRSVLFFYSLEVWFWIAVMQEREFREVADSLDVDFHMRTEWRSFNKDGSTNPAEALKVLAEEADVSRVAMKLKPGTTGLEQEAGKKEGGSTMKMVEIADTITNSETIEANPNAAPLSLTATSGGGAAPEKNNATTLGEQLTGEERHALLQLMRGMHQLCDAFQFPYLLSSGTLLGALRHHSLIPWTGDAEVSMDYSYFPFAFNVALLQSVFLADEDHAPENKLARLVNLLGEWAVQDSSLRTALDIFSNQKMVLQMYARRALSLKFFYSDAQKFSDPVPGFSYRFPYLDLHPNYFDETSQEVGYTSYLFGYRFPLNWVYPRKVAYIEGQPFFVWADSEKVIAALYKGNALRECRGHHLHHRGIQMDRARQKKVYNCTQLPQTAVATVRDMGFKMLLKREVLEDYAARVWVMEKTSNKNIQGDETAIAGSAQAEEDVEADFFASDDRTPNDRGDRGQVSSARATTREEMEMLQDKNDKFKQADVPTISFALDRCDSMRWEGEILYQLCFVEVHQEEQLYHKKMKKRVWSRTSIRSKQPTVVLHLERLTGAHLQVLREKHSTQIGDILLTVQDMIE